MPYAIMPYVKRICFYENIPILSAVSSQLVKNNKNVLT